MTIHTMSSCRNKNSKLSTKMSNVFTGAIEVVRIMWTAGSMEVNPDSQ